MIFSHRIFKTSLLIDEEKCNIRSDDHGFNHISIYKLSESRKVIYFKEYSNKACYLYMLTSLDNSYNRITRENIMKINCSGLNILRVPYYQKNDKIIKTAALINSAIIKFIPENLLVLSLIIYIVERSFTAVNYLPERFITPIVLNSIRPNCKKYINFVHHDIPDTERTWFDYIFLSDKLRPDDWPFPSKSYKELQEDQYD